MTRRTDLQILSDLIGNSGTINILRLHERFIREHPKRAPSQVELRQRMKHVGYDRDKTWYDIYTRR